MEKSLNAPKKVALKFKEGFGRNIYEVEWKAN